ncbi:hypothetical protein AMET1_0702 [Methanonatronarchaeum thermophilum]|uniref:Uncharacterized protein n=1 Tax=Methanonatronarchaeum thermophilum TaxID=1927129 RepID=A0A1Y3GCT5_9EURY|nr:hypothetical protein AMET1_0702 [Methanonatronarchaeum thermophilum]
MDTTYRSNLISPPPKQGNKILTKKRNKTNHKDD